MQKEGAMRYEDQFLLCPDCARPFPFSAKSQRLADELGYETPTICRSCHRTVEAARR